MFDADLFFAVNERPLIVPGATITPALFPTSLAPKWLDFVQVMDMARGKPVYAHFRIASAFTSIAANYLRPAIFVDSNTAFITILTNPENTIARGHDVPNGALGSGSVGSVITLPVPPLSDYTLIAAEGRRYLTLGLEVYVPTTDWSAGGIDAWLDCNPFPARPSSKPSGY